MADRPLTFRELRQDAEQRKRAYLSGAHPFAFLLDDFQDPRNVGAIFRIADAIRARAVYLYGPAAISSRKIARYSRSASDWVPAIQLSRPEDVARLRETFQMVALEHSTGSIPLADFSPRPPTLLLVGNERRGLDPELLGLAQTAVHIPMYGVNTSMNAAVAAGIAAYQIIKDTMQF